MTTRSSKRGTASWAVATTRVRASQYCERWSRSRTSLIPLPPSAAGDLIALCDAQLLDAASCEEIYLHNATRGEASSGGEPPLMQVRRLDGQTPRAAPVAAASTTAAASHHRRR